MMVFKWSLNGNFFRLQMTVHQNAIMAENDQRNKNIASHI